MTGGDFELDVIVLVPGKDEEAVIDALLSMRNRSLRIRSVDHKILIHPQRDPGCYHRGAELLRPYTRQARHALVLFDLQGSGQENRAGDDLAADLQQRLEAGGWGNRAAVIVVEPELEAWVWSDSPEVDEVLGWRGHEPPLREWLTEHGLWGGGDVKPQEPKEALDAARYEMRKPRSSAIYRALAENVGLRRCEDAAFRKLRGTLQSWFGAD